MNKLAATRLKAEEKRMAAEAKRNQQAAKTAQEVEYIRRTGRIPSSFSCWGLCSWFQITEASSAWYVKYQRLLFSIGKEHFHYLDHFVPVHANLFTFCKECKFLCTIFLSLFRASSVLLSLDYWSLFSSITWILIPFSLKDPSFIHLV